MKKTLIAKKAMVYALTAAMLVASPLTASAAEADYSDAFDDFELTINPDMDDQNDESGTDTITASTTLTLGDDKGAYILSIAYTDPKRTGLEYGVDNAKDENGRPVASVTAKVEAADGKEIPAATMEMLKKMMTWHVYRPGTSVGFNGYGNDPDVPAYKPFAVSVAKDGTKAIRDVAYLTPKFGGDADLVCAIDDWKNDFHFEARLPIHVTEYSTALKYAAPLTVYAKHIYNLGSYKRLERVGNGQEGSNPNETLTFTWADGKNPGKKYAEIINGSQLKVKKDLTQDAEIIVTGGKPDKDGKGTVSATLTIKKGQTIKARKVEIDAGKSIKWEVKDNENSKTLTAEITNPKNSTDTITWSSNKPGVVAVYPVDPDADGCSNKVVIRGWKEGTARITAKATSGRKATLKVKVTSALTKLDAYPVNAYYNKDNNVYYSRVNSANNTKLKVEVPTEYKKVLKATYKNGAVTIKAKKPISKEQADKPFNVTLKSAKRTIDVKTPFATTLKYSDVTSLIVRKGNGQELPAKKGDGGSIKAGQIATFRAYPNNKADVAALTVKSSNKVASVSIDPETGKITVWANSPGKKAKKVKITVIGYGQNKRKQQVQFTVNVTP